ncbi:NUDIX hydrolase [Micromonospora cathayae]|uniref:NUDIX hydrolase n=1 Tax=Micromonospora cathayae TaxID=3028804 RepID=A0ABY7ZL14_9ACTN|nr:NUDIX hydrolase [Micromonospora sp. HUAS 3]WDZ83595.1 NUDIX hydrolase [Micromonospora sp. HUAS 3]
MRDSVAVVAELVADIVPADPLEAEHRADTLRWLSGTDDVFRRARPATPARHLVSYVVPVDPDDGGVLLVDHVNAGLWLPPGGHVEPDEHPAATARREAHEELGLVLAEHAVAEVPAFLTVTRTVGIDAGHTDVSLWYVVEVRRDQRLDPEQGEFRAARWWSPAELSGTDPARFDPHFGRFRAKLSGRPSAGT